MLTRDGAVRFRGLRMITDEDVTTFRERLLVELRGGGRRVVFDLTHTRAISHEALGQLKRLSYEILQFEGASLGFEHVSEALAQSLKAARFDHVFRISRGVDEIKRTTPELPV